MRQHFSLQPLSSGWWWSMLVIYANHPFAPDGAGWFSCFQLQLNSIISYLSKNPSIFDKYRDVTGTIAKKELLIIYKRNIPFSEKMFYSRKAYFIVTFFTMIIFCLSLFVKFVLIAPFRKFKLF